MTRNLIKAMIVGAVLVAAGPVLAQECEGEPEIFIQGLGNRVVEILATEGLDQTGRKSALQGVFREHVAVETVGRVVIGRFWKGATDDQRRRYLSIFPDYISNIYAGQLVGLAGTDVAVGGSVTFGESDVLVNAAFILPDDPPVLARFRVRCIAGDLKLLDAMVSGISIVVTKRDEFTSFVRNNGIDALIAAMERLN